MDSDAASITSIRNPPPAYSASAPRLSPRAWVHLKAREWWTHLSRGKYSALPVYSVDNDEVFERPYSVGPLLETRYRDSQLTGLAPTPHLQKRLENVYVHVFYYYIKFEAFPPKIKPRVHDFQFCHSAALRPVLESVTSRL